MRPRLKPPTPGSKRNPKPKPPALITGQLWQLQTGYLHVTRVGKTLTEYKLLTQPGQKTGQFQLASHATVGKYLKINRAKLLGPP